MAADWQRGDRCLLSPTGKWRDWTAATVTRVDEHGVHVQLVRAVRGTRFATASPHELVAIPRKRPGRSEACDEHTLCWGPPNHERVRL